MKKLLIQMYYEASTNNFPISFPYPMHLLNIKEEDDTLIDTILLCKDKVKADTLKYIDDIINLINSGKHSYDQIIVNMGEYPADADRYEYFEYFLDKIRNPISIIGTYPTVNFKRVGRFNNFINGQNITILETDFDITKVIIPNELIEKYPVIGTKKRAVMKVTVGCPQRCKMCPVPAIYDGKYRYDSVENIITKIKHYYNNGVRFITFTDDNISASDKRFVKVMEAIKEANLKGMKFHAQEGFEVTAFSNEDFCRLLVETGWEQVKLGVENIKPDFLKKIGKYYVDPSAIDTALANISKYGIKDARFFYLMGLDETEEDVMDNLRYFSKHMVQLRTNVLRKYFGTELYDMTWDLKLDEKTISKLKALSYAISWMSLRKFDIFEENAYDNFCKKFNYVESKEGDTTIITGRMKYGFQSDRLKNGLKFMYEQKYGLKDVIATIVDDNTLTFTLPKKEVVGKWF